MKNIFHKAKKVMGLTPNNNTSAIDSQINMAIGIKGDQMVINFGKPIAFITMNKLQALGLMEALAKQIPLLK